MCDNINFSNYEDFDQIINCCSGYFNNEIISTQDMINFWNKVDCPSVYYFVINNNDDGNLIYSPENQEKAQELTNSTLTNYTSTYNLNDSTIDFQSTLLELCTNNSIPGVCQSFLTNYCQQFSRDDVKNDAYLTQFCGCYVPPDDNVIQYTTGTKECLEGLPDCTYNCTTENNENCVPQPSCDALCNNVNVSQKINNLFGLPIVCKNTSICVIDNVVINTFNSTYNNINFNSFCPNCIHQNCECIINTNNENDVNINFQSFCGANSTCIMNDGNNVSQVECDGLSSNSTSFKYINSSIIFWIIILSIFILLMLGIEIYLNYLNKK